VPARINPADILVLLLYNLDPRWPDEDREEVASATDQLGDAMAAMGHPTTMIPIVNDDMAGTLRDYDPREAIVLNWCESFPGVTHSEWLVAQTLEHLNFTFTGASSAALSLAVDKFRVKYILDQMGIPTPAWRLYESLEDDGWNHFPAIVKAVNEHSSEGITREAVVMSPEELRKRITFILDTYHQPALVEDFIDGREFHVSIWGNGHIEMLPPVEMDFSSFKDVQDRLCTWDAKFIPGSEAYERIQTLLPAPLTDDEYQALEFVSKAAYIAVGCRDYGRIDVRLRGGIFYVLDINPNADISADASLACAAEQAGYSYGQLGSHLINLASQRHPVWGKKTVLTAKPRTRTRERSPERAPAATRNTPQTLPLRF